MSSDVDIIEIGQRLRELLAAYDNAAFALDQSFADIDMGLEAAAQGLRPVLQRSADHIFNFTAQLERTPVYSEMRSARLKEKL